MCFQFSDIITTPQSQAYDAKTIATILQFRKAENRKSEPESFLGCYKVTNNF